MLLALFIFSLFVGQEVKYSGAYYHYRKLDNKPLLEMVLVLLFWPVFLWPVKKLK